MATKKAAKSVAKKSVKKATKTRKAKPEAVEPEIEVSAEVEIATPGPMVGVEDPIGDTADGEGRVLLVDEAPAGIVDESAEGEAGSVAEVGDGTAEEDDDSERAALPAGKPERLQKILAQSGVASRRKAEEMIEQGRVQVNGKVVTTLGTKADANRDHIRVDGKLLHGSERLRYFVLNKPKGYVTTVKDPEGRPTVMQFFEKMRERLYPVGRLDYMSEGLLVVTNDGELANKLTKAGSGVEKVYLVKVAGQPTEEELDLLRAGVNIERGKPGSPRVRTSPARIRQVRQGDNPWYEVVLIEGRNRELRKMFVAVGHFVEKIRRVGYGPLVLDQEPGKMRELDAEELAALRLAAEGKLKTPKAKELRRRNLADAQLPTVRPKPTMARPGKPFENKRPFEAGKRFGERTFEKGAAGTAAAGEYRPKRTFGGDKPFRPTGEGFRPAAGRPEGDRGKFGAKKFGASGSGPERPARKRDDRGTRPPAGRTFGGKPTGRPFADKPAGVKAGFGKPALGKQSGNDRPPSKRPAAPRREAPVRDDDFVPIKPGGLRIDPIEPSQREKRTQRAFSRPPMRQGTGRLLQGRPAFDRPRTGKPNYGKPQFERPGTDRPRFESPGPGKPRFEKSAPERPRFEKSRFDRADSIRAGDSDRGRSSGPSRPPRGSSSMGRPFATDSGRARVGGSRPTSKPGKSGGFKPGGSSKPRPGGFSKPAPKRGGFKGKPGGAGRSGPRSEGRKSS